MARSDNHTPRVGQYYRPGRGAPLHRATPSHTSSLTLRFRSPRRSHDGSSQTRRAAVKIEHGESDNHASRSSSSRAPASRPLAPGDEVVGALRLALGTSERRPDELERLNHSHYRMKVRLSETEAELRALNESLMASSGRHKAKCRAQELEFYNLKQQTAGQERIIADLRHKIEEQSDCIQSAQRLRHNDQASLANLRQSIDILTNQVIDRNETIRGMNDLVHRSCRAITFQEALDLAIEAQATTTLNMVSDLQAAVEQADQQAVQQKAGFDSHVKELEFKIRAQASIIEQTKTSQTAYYRTHIASRLQLQETQKKLEETEQRLAAAQESLEARDRNLLEANRRNDLLKDVMDKFREVTNGK